MPKQSYTHQTKIALAALKIGTTGQLRAELSAMIRTCGSLHIERDSLSVELLTENPVLRGRVDEMLERLGYGKTADGREETRFNRTMEAFTIPSEVASEVLTACCIMSDGHIVEGIEPQLIDSTDDCEAFVRGAFFGSGTLTMQNGYGLEFLFARERLAEDFCALVNALDVSARVVERGNRFVVYLKNVQDICDVLAHIGATKAVIDLQTARAERMMKEIISRQCNCEVFNTEKTISAAERAIADIDLIAKTEGLSTLSEELQTVARARKEDPTETLPELAARLGLTKSCLRHRLRKIVEIAARLRLDTDAEI